MRSIAIRVAICLTVLSLSIAPAMADRTALKAGSTVFSNQQDVDFGRRLSRDLESQMPVTTNSFARAYMEALGAQLAAHAPGYRFPYQFRIVTDDEINAYALPGGFIYVTSGLVQAAETEAQLAGVLAHQIGHVVMRHASQAISREYTRERNSTVRGSVSVNDAMSQLGLGFYSDSIYLQHTPQAERDADVIAAQILFDTKFDPRMAAAGFQHLRTEPQSLTSELFANHPWAANRVTRVRTETQKLGALPRDLRTDSPDLDRAQGNLSGNNASNPDSDDNWTDYEVETPSTRMVTYRGRSIEFRYPDNWRVSEDNDAISITPDNGSVNGSLAYGMNIATFDPESGYFGQNTLTPRAGSSADSTTLSRATDELINDLRRSNPNMEVIRETSRRVDGEQALVTELRNDSPVGGFETDWLVTVLRPDGLLHYFIGVAPRDDFSRFSSTFERIMTSVRFVD